MDIVKGFPSTMQDDYQLNISNIIKHAVRNADKQEIVCKVGDTMFRHTYADAYGRMMRFANALKGLVRSDDMRGLLVGPLRSLPRRPTVGWRVARPSFRSASVW